MMAGFLRKQAAQKQAAEVSARIKALDYELISICCEPENCLTLRAVDQLAKMQRRLRSLRHEIEVEAGIW